MKPKFKHIAIYEDRKSSPPALMIGVHFDIGHDYLSGPIHGTNDDVALQLETLARRIREDRSLQED